MSAIETAYIDQLPAELLIQIFNNLDPESLNSCSAVCSRWKKIAADDQIWKRIVFSEKNGVEDLDRAIPFREQYLITMLSARNMVSLRYHEQKFVVPAQKCELIGKYLIYQIKGRILIYDKRGEQLSCFRTDCSIVHDMEEVAAPQNTFFQFIKGNLYVRDIKTGNLIFYHEEVMPGICLFVDDKLLLSSKKREVQLWDIRRKECLKNINGLPRTIQMLKFSHPYLVVIDHESKIHCFDIRQERKIAALRHPQKFRILHLQIMIDRLLLIQFSGGDYLYRYDLREQKKISCLPVNRMCCHKNKDSFFKVWHQYVFCVDAECCATLSIFDSLREKVVSKISCSSARHIEGFWIFKEYVAILDADNALIIANWKTEKILHHHTWADQKIRIVGQYRNVLTAWATRKHYASELLTVEIGTGKIMSREKWAFTMPTPVQNGEVIYFSLSK